MQNYYVPQKLYKSEQIRLYRAVIPYYYSGILATAARLSTVGTFKPILC